MCQECENCRRYRPCVRLEKSPLTAAPARRSDSPEAPETGEHAPQKMAMKYDLCVESLRQNNERADRARTLRIYPLLILFRAPAQALAAPRVIIAVAGRYGRGEHARQRNNRARMRSQAGEIRRFSKCRINLTTIMVYKRRYSNKAWLAPTSPPYLLLHAKSKEFPYITVVRGLILLLY